MGQQMSELTGLQFNVEEERLIEARLVSLDEKELYVKVTKNRALYKLVLKGLSNVLYPLEQCNEK